MAQSEETATIEHQLSVLQQKYDYLADSMLAKDQDLANLVRSRDKLRGNNKKLRSKLSKLEGANAKSKNLADLVSVLATENANLASELLHVKQNVNNLTAERSAWLKKLRRAGVKV